jgi:mono/diheme cytochrome c family protein
VCPDHVRAGAPHPLAWLLAAGLLATAACVAYVEPPALELGLAPESPEDAARDFLDACAPCHGAGGRGDGPVAPALRVPPPDLTRLAARHGGAFPRAYVIDVIAGERGVVAHGSREMPVWSQRFAPSAAGATAAAALYARRRLAMLARHLETLQRPGEGAP